MRMIVLVLWHVVINFPKMLTAFMGFLPCLATHAKIGNLVMIVNLHSGPFGPLDAIQAGKACQAASCGTFACRCLD